MAISSDAERNRRRRARGADQIPPQLPSLEDTERWALLAAAVKAQGCFDAVGFTAERPIDLRSDRAAGTD